MVSRKLTDEEIETLQTKCSESEWSLSDDSALCHVLEGCRNHYMEHVEKLGLKIARINQLASLLNSGVGHLNSSVIHAANSRFIQQQLSEDVGSKVCAIVEAPNNSGDGRADTIATISAAIRQGITATNRVQDMNDLCSTRPVIGSQSFKDSFLTHVPAAQKQAPTVLANSSSTLNVSLPYPHNEAAASSSDEFSVRAPQSSMQSTVMPVPVNSSGGVLPHSSVTSSNSSVRSLTSIPVPTEEEFTPSVDAGRNPNEEVFNSADRVTKDAGSTLEKSNNVLQAPKIESRNKISSVNIFPKPVISKDDGDKMKPSSPILDRSEPHVEPKRDKVQDVFDAEEKEIKEENKRANVTEQGKGSLKSGMTTQSITKKYASIFDSDSDDEALFVDPRKSLLGASTESDMGAMKKVQIPKKLESSGFAKVLADKLTKGPALAPSASVSKPVKDAPEIKSNQKENSDVSSSWPLPSVAKTRPRGPTRRPPSRSKLNTAAAGADVIEKPSPGSSEKPSPDASLDTVEASSHSNLVRTDEVTAKSKDESPASSTIPGQISRSTEQAEEKVAKPPTMRSAAPSTVPSVASSSVPSAASSIVPSAASSAVPKAAPSTVPKVAPSTVPKVAPSTVPSAAPSTVTSAAPSTVTSAASSTAPRANVSKMARSFFDSESDDDIGAGDNNKSGGNDSSISKATPKSGAAVREEPARENPAKSSASSQGALAQTTTKPQFAKGLFDDDEEDDDLSMFRSSKPKKS